MTKKSVRPVSQTGAGGEDRLPLETGFETAIQKQRQAVRRAGPVVAGAFGLAVMSAAAVFVGSLTQTAPVQAQEALFAGQAALPRSFAPLVKKVRPAVVSIQVSSDGRSKKGRKGRSGRRGFPDLPDDHPLNEFFKRFGGKGNGAVPRLPSRAQGSGFIISADGYVVTNHHVVDGADEIKLTLNNGRKVTAKLVGSDDRTDIALLKINERGTYPTVKFSSSPAEVGDWVIAVGNPFGLGGTVTAGIVSAKGREVGQSPYDYIQIDAAVNRGNSGGPTFNLKGEVVGVNTAIYSPSGGNVGIAFAVTAKVTKKVVDQLRENGRVRRGWLGVSIQTIDEELAAGLGLDDPHGALVSKISRGGPASRSKLRVGDAIIAVNGERVEDSRDLARKIADLAPKSIAHLTVFRGGREIDIDVKLGQFPSLKKLAALDDQPLQGEDGEDNLSVLGLSLAPSPDGGEGVEITNVDPDSEAFLKGLRPGTVILKVGGKSVSEPGDVVRLVREAKRKSNARSRILLQVKRNNVTRFLALKLTP